MNPCRHRWTVVLVLSGVVFGSAACGIPTSSGPTAIARSDVPYRLVNPPATTAHPLATSDRTCAHTDAVTIALHSV